MAWAKSIGRFLLISVLWAIYCFVNVRLDYALFWHQYSVGNPTFNLELFVVNALQAGPILLGAAYAIYRITPSFYAGNLPTSLPSNPAAEEHLQSLLS